MGKKSWTVQKYDRQTSIIICISTNTEHRNPIFLCINRVTIGAQHAKKSELKSPAVENYGVRDYTPRLVIPETIFFEK